MKRHSIMIRIVCMVAFIFAACSKGTLSQVLTSNESVSRYLSSAASGTSIDDPLALAVKIDLQNMSANDSGWKKLLAAINTAGKYVALDLSACTMPGTEFKPDSSFADGKEFIVSLILPDTAVKIADESRASNPTFNYFVNLSSIPNGKSLTAIGECAFSTIKLTNLTIPDGVTTIGNAAFYGCELTSVIFPNSITDIERYAFQDNELTSVIFPDSLTTIGQTSFSNNYMLSNISIPNSITSIGDSAFFNCLSLNNVTIPDSVKSIGQNAFAIDYGGDWRTCLTSITIGANVDLSSRRSFGDGFDAFYYSVGRQAGTYTRRDFDSRTWSRSEQINYIGRAAVPDTASSVPSDYLNRESLSIYNWSYYTPLSIIEKFEKEYGVRVVVDEYVSNEEMYTKLATGGTGYDLVFPSQDYVSIMIRQDMLEQIDASLVPNLKNIDPAVIQKIDCDPNMQYSVPFNWGIVGIIINTARVPTYEKNWSIFARSDLRNC